MDSEQGKLFIGGISWETTEDVLKDYFGNYGDVLQTAVMREKLSGRPRGFGFVVFADPSVLDGVLQDKHIIDRRTVEVKRALSREEQQASKAGNTNIAARNFGGGGNFRTKKIFVGGLPPTLTEDGFRQYFESFGNVTDVVVMYDQSTNRPRGFGFISFDSEDAVEKVLENAFHDLNGKQVEVKRALPKDANPGGGSRSMSCGGGNGVSGGGYQGYGGSGGNSRTYDGRMDSSMYMQSQSTGVGFPPYGYGFGNANNSIGYNGYGGYGATNAGYGGPAGVYGNPNALPGMSRKSWNIQAPGYGSVSYGTPALWGASTIGGSPAPTGQPPSSVTGYGNQGYGYGAYGGSDGPHASSAAYGLVGGHAGIMPGSNVSTTGGELPPGSVGCKGGSYGDASEESGYGSKGWRSDNL